jgi:hypothetical protein
VFLFTAAGGGVKTFVQSDIRLRGFSSLSSVSYEVLEAPVEASNRAGSSGGSSDSNVLDAGYRAVYRILCGGGYGTFTLWQVCLEARPVLASASGASPGAAAGAVSSGEVTFKYSQLWEVIQTGSVNAPTMVFGLVLQAPSAANRPPGLSCSGSGSDSCNFFLQGINKDTRLFTTPAAPVKQVNDPMTSEIGDPLTAPLSSPGGGAVSVLLASAKGQNRSFRGMTNVLAGSADGLTLFCGGDELIVYR